MTDIIELYDRADKLTLALANNTRTMGEIVKERDDIKRLSRRMSARYRHIINNKLGYIDSELRGAA